tara:strand:- start:12148 stop:12609 length:462 start_codon:yes stop_codon:yes gene_type:complete
MGIAVSNKQRLLKINRKRLQRNANFWLTSVSSEETKVSLVFLRDRFMQNLNFQFRGIKETTDVLAFPDLFESKVFDNNPMFEDLKDKNFLGDVVISTDEVLRLSFEEKKTTDDLIDELFLHGILHLHDYDHQNKKEKVQMRKIERKLFENRPN